VPTALEMLFPSNWLDSKAEGDDKGRTNRQVQGEVRLCVFFFRFAFSLPAKVKILPINAKDFPNPYHDG
jgi:hypothetical protein